MKKAPILFTILLLTLFSCKNDDEANTSKISNITFNFSHTWENTPVTNTDFNALKFTNANGNMLSINKLRYLISNITFTSPQEETLILDDYFLVDLTNNTLSFNPETKIPTGTYSNVSFIFGFDNNNNYNTNYPDLNSASWNVPSILGGGYHYMQLEGKFTDNSSTETGYAYHAIRAVDNSGATQKFQDTFFKVNLGEITITNDATITIEMNIANWFQTPNTWDLNTLNNMLMPNFNAQVMMFENANDVFSLKNITQ